MPEVRDTVQHECRFEERDDGARVISGYAARFYDGSAGTEYQLYEDVFERIDPAAFDDALENDDVRALFNHSADNLLGRSGAKTLKLSVDQKGLRYDIELGDTTVAKDVAKHIKRGDLYGSSFAFVPTKVEWTDEGTREIRTVKGVRLLDVGPVTYPAYESTSTAMRSAWTDERDAWKEEKETNRVRTGDREIRSRRLRLMQQEED